MKKKNSIENSKKELLLEDEEDVLTHSLGREAGVPWVWVCGGALATILVMFLALFGIVIVQGLTALWPKTIVEFQSDAGQTHVAVAYRMIESKEEGKSETEKFMLFQGNRDFGLEEFVFASPDKVKKAESSYWFMERLEWGPFIGTPLEFISQEAEGALETRREVTPDLLQKEIKMAHRRLEEISDVEHSKIRPINLELEDLRLKRRGAARRLATGETSDDSKIKKYNERIESLTTEYDLAAAKVRELINADLRYRIRLKAPNSSEKEIPVSQIVRAFQPNTLSFLGKAKIFVARCWEFLSTEPREANTAGGVFPALFGTMVMTFLMTIAVLPLGVLTAVYMREIAKQGFFVSIVRIAVVNLAGVPSIVYGIFGLGFFCYTMGTTIDGLFFSDKLPNPTFGTGGILWASLTLALLTVPVVIVSTEEALSSVPRTLREASYGCGATRLQTLLHIVIPKATPGILTGLILAMARGAGEVAPLLMTGVVKLAPALPIDTHFPFLHLERSFMHLGFHIYDLGFQSRSTEASRPMVFATTLLLIALVLVLNFFAFKLRSLLRRRFEGRGAF